MSLRRDLRGISLKKVKEKSLALALMLRVRNGNDGDPLKRELEQRLSGAWTSANDTRWGGILEQPFDRLGTDCGNDRTGRQAASGPRRSAKESGRESLGFAAAVVVHW
jgi:hypothetical protein